ncbi:CTP synthase [Hydrogenothermus marinus]|uniref:CTP synthase n=1 Tax=Hydrogenothermus marinus TaxID=133270 RepID=A0A3M0B8U8_9AQUI|nr:CTP synthase [Hydrogenothermus marinus]RMA92559.1 CTP synthase [Hydrogenothermus marinus]
MQKFIFITGGVLSSLGKGVTSAGIGAILESMGYKITFLKLDPYLNIDPGTMNPYQHGEVYVTEDGAETDLDLGHYERFTHVVLTKYNNATSGKLYNTILEKERRGAYLGATVQIIPHFTNEIKRAIEKAADGADIILVEIGGTVGDIESLPFLEAIRQMSLELGKENSLFIHLTYVPYIKAAGELKTKPSQHSVKELRAIGIQPDILICRAEKPLPKAIKRKLALFTNVDEDAVLSAPDLNTIYEIPLLLKKEKLDQVISKNLKLEYKEPDLTHWKKIVNTWNNLEKTDKEVNIAIIGKYIELKDAYKSIDEALIHASIANKVKVNLNWVKADDLTEENIYESLKDIDGILIPGGFGERGIEGKILAAKYARENNIPYFGICLGMQVAVIEFARNVVGLKGANSTEFDPETPYPVIDLMPEQRNINNKGGTMRLGAYKCTLKEGTKAFEIYGKKDIYERHRHRYEFNPEFRPILEEKGLVVSGEYTAKKLPEIIELPEHKWFIGCQFHPEFKSKPFAPHPLFVAFVEASYKNRLEKIN